MTEGINKWLYAFKFIEAPLFLLQLLHATDTSRANKQVVYPLLAANLEKLDEHLLQILQHQIVRTLTKHISYRSTISRTRRSNGSNVFKFR